MNNSVNPSAKNGAALIITLGFLAVLTFLVVLFSMQTRTERISGRTYLSAAQNRHLLNTALARAVDDIAWTAGTEYPSFLATNFPGDGLLISDTLNFSTEEDYLPLGNKHIRTAYIHARDHAEWQMVFDDHQCLGRVGCIVVNSSGLLDANHAGSLQGEKQKQRSAGQSPDEIHLSKKLIKEISSTLSNFPLLSPSGNRSTPSPETAFIHNRDNAWFQFETLRDLKTLNQRARANIFSHDISSFSTYSLDPRIDDRIFMGTNSATLNTEAVRSHLPAVAHPEFVLNQLRDYLDTDALPEDKNGLYTDFSVEPVPLINEITLALNTAFTPILVPDDENGLIVSQVEVTNTLSLNIELWYPFTNYTNTDTFAIGFKNIDADPYPPEELLGTLSQWENKLTLPANIGEPGFPPMRVQIHNTNSYFTATTPTDITSAFNDLATDISIKEFTCVNQTQQKVVDKVHNFTFPLEDGTSETLRTEIHDIAADLFNSETAFPKTNYFEIGKAVIDPRLNWNGQNTNQWINVDSHGFFPHLPTPNQINYTIIKDKVTTPDQTDFLYIRNADQIDSPYEFTFLLPSPKHPWHTFQMLKENDPAQTRSVLKHLTTQDPMNPVKNGKINPYTPHKSVIASAFMDMPIDEFSGPLSKRLTAQQAQQAADIFMNEVRTKGWPSSADQFGSLLFKNILPEEANSWELESFFRNTYELFNPRDSLYAIILAAQNGYDLNNDNIITNDEVRNTQKAIVYIWRDPLTGKSACVFFGLTDSLKKNSWSTLLKQFKP